MSTITTGVGSPGAVSSASGGKTYGYNGLTTTPALVVSANPARQSLIFHNPGTVDIFVAPLFIQNSGSDLPFTPTTSQLGGCFRVFANGGTLTLVGECQKAYNAFAASGTGNPLTVVESNV